MSVYLDYNASAPINASVLDEMILAYKESIGNPDSRTHDFGDHARSRVENARKQVASLLGVENEEIFFTSGATESNNIAIQGIEKYARSCGKTHLVTTAIEHKAVLETAKAMKERGFDVDFVVPDRSGRVSADQIMGAIRDETVLVSIMHANNETGIIQPVDEIGKKLKKKGVLFHVDATQTCGKLVDELRNANYDMLSLSAHKLAGPQGIGALVLRKKKYKLPPVTPVFYGGEQEHGIRPGTVPVALAVGLGEACAIAENNYKDCLKKLLNIKTVIKELIEKSGLEYHYNGDQENCMPNTLNVSLIGVASEALMLATKQHCGISNGSACTSKSYAPSYVLTAMGLPSERIESAIRISWGPETDIVGTENSLALLLETARSLVE